MSDRSNMRLLSSSEFWSGLTGLATAAFVIYSGVGLGIGSINDPGSGFMLFYVGILMVVFAGSIVIASIRRGGPTVAEQWASARWTKPIIVIAALIAFAAALNPLGFLISTTALMLVLLRAIDPVRWPIAIPIAVLAPFASWWVVTRLLAIQLPSGIFEIG